MNSGRWPKGRILSVNSDSVLSPFKGHSKWKTLKYIGKSYRNKGKVTKTDRLMMKITLARKGKNT